MLFFSPPLKLSFKLLWKQPKESLWLQKKLCEFTYHTPFPDFFLMIIKVQLN
jgi:hypothetical protein